MTQERQIDLKTCW